MTFFELKIPPVALVLLFALAMWGIAGYTPSLVFSLPWSSGMAIALVLAGIVICLAGVFEFRTARTTIDPTHPDAASSVVTSGIYRMSRNPMYLGFLILLAGWAVYLSHLLAFALLPVLVVYMNRFQIIPEERMLATKFGAEFTGGACYHVIWRHVIEHSVWFL